MPLYKAQKIQTLQLRKMNKGQDAKAVVDGAGNVVIQNSDNSTITINISNPADVRNALLNLQGEIRELPLNIIKHLMERNVSEVPSSGANVYLSLNILCETFGGKPTGGIAGVSFGVSVVNTNKEHRYFYEPCFKSSEPLEKGLDTFIMTDKHPDNPQFPKRLEYGEVFTAYYNIPNIDLFKKLYEKNTEAIITAVVNTTLGEVFISNEYKIESLLQNEKYIRNDFSSR